MNVNSTDEEITVAAGQTGATPWLSIEKGLAVQITGTAATATVLVERSTRDPDLTPGPNTALVETITGSAAAGIAPRAFDEPGTAWWRARATVVTGGPIVLAVNGRWGG